MSKVQAGLAAVKRALRRVVLGERVEQHRLIKKVVAVDHGFRVVEDEYFDVTTTRRLRRARSAAIAPAKPVTPEEFMRDVTDRG